MGFKCVDSLARRWNIPLERRHRLVVLGEGEVSERRVVLAKPRTFVNLSGEAVWYLLERFGAEPEQLLVVYDDMDLPLGKLRLRPKGGPGGHKGVASITTALGTQGFPRLRIGIGRPAEVDEVQYVLGPFTAEEEPVVKESLALAVEAISCVLERGLEEAMNRFN